MATNAEKEQIRLDHQRELRRILPPKHIIYYLQVWEHDHSRAFSLYTVVGDEIILINHLAVEMLPWKLTVKNSRGHVVRGFFGKELNGEELVHAISEKLYQSARVLKSAELRTF